MCPAVPRAGAAAWGPAVPQDCRWDSDWKLCGFRSDRSVSFSAPSSKELLLFDYLFIYLFIFCGCQKLVGDLGSIFDSEYFRCIYYRESQCSDLLTDLSEPGEPRVEVRISLEDGGTAGLGLMLMLQTDLPVHFTLLLHIGNYDHSGN